MIFLAQSKRIINQIGNLIGTIIVLVVQSHLGQSPCPHQNLSLQNLDWTESELEPGHAHMMFVRHIGANGRRAKRRSLAKMDNLPLLFSLLTVKPEESFWRTVWSSSITGISLTEV